MTPIAIAEWLLLGEDREYMTRGKYDEAAQITGIRVAELQNYVWVYRKTREISSREEIQSFKHLKVLAPLDPKEQQRWADKLEKTPMPAQRLLDARAIIPTEPRRRSRRRR